MKRHALQIGLALVVVAMCLLPAVSQAQKMVFSDKMLKDTYRDILSQTDKNRDGKLSTSECLTIYKDKQKGEKVCKYLDANGDGVVTEDEYFRQTRKITP